MTNDLTVRPLCANDVDIVLAFESANQQFFEQWVPPRTSTYFDREEQITRLQKLADDRMNRYWIVLNQGGSVVGRINATFEQRPGTLVASLDYRVAQDQQGKGIATFAINKIVDWIVADGRFCAIEARAMKTNYGSVKVLEKAGLKEVAESTITKILNGQPIILHLFRKTAKCYPGTNSKQCSC